MPTHASYSSYVAKSGLQQPVHSENIDEMHRNRDEETGTRKSASTVAGISTDEQLEGIKVEDSSLVVDWANSDDPENPLNWSDGRRWAMTALISAFTFGAPFPSSMTAPAVAQYSADLHIQSKIVGAMATSIFILAFAVGPLFLGPMSEIFGRAIIFQVSNVWFIVWNTACGFAHSPTQLIVFRFLAGLGACATTAIGGATLGDMWTPERRGKALAIYNLMPSLGPVMGPLVGSWIAEKSTWRWIFWSSSIFQAVIQMGGLFLLRETYAPVLLERKAKRVVALLENNCPVSDSEKRADGVITVYRGVAIRAVKTKYTTENRRWKNIMYTALTRPFALFFREPIVQVMGSYLAYVYGTLYLFLTTIPRTFRGVYGQGLGVSGLNYIALGIGIVVASQVNANTSNPIYKHLKMKYGGEGKPEYRLPIIVPASILLPVGMLITGWAAEKKVFWLVADIGLVVYGMGMIINFQSLQIYIIDAFGIYSASALAATSCLRSLAGFGFPLFAPSMYDSLGYGVSNTILAAAAIVIGCPAPVLLWFYGERLRKASRYSKKT